MSLDEYKLVLVSVFLVLVLVAASPTLSMVIDWPAGERFTELWVLGPGHMAEGYPFDVRENMSYSVFLGMSNRMGGLEYYVAFVKFRNQTEPLPNATTGEPSIVTSSFEYRVFLSAGEVWEKNVTFSFSGVSLEGDMCRVSYLVVDGFSSFVNKTATWDAANKGYYFQVFFELWRYNATTSVFEYHNRFVSLWLNMTATV
ncbi:MAG: DUF1616 domain-containing protein [Candidatus Bathyarchaeia archaeon]|nr:DUF1616 domain-containing protein [Candidatus Bathyarchaeota archaeon A05DMB-4]MDH7596074.1 DUF1616 domain-containing protein [Candidatus Bathyarchaeota archaeon]